MTVQGTFHPRTALPYRKEAPQTASGPKVKNLSRLPTHSQAPSRPSILRRGCFRPTGLGADIDDILQLLAEPDDAEADHARIEAQGGADATLDGARGIEAHDEVMALGVRGLMDPSSSRQREGSPVGEAAHDPARVEDQHAGRLGDAEVPCGVHRG